MICVGVPVHPLAAPVAILAVAVEVHVQQVDAAIGDAADRAAGAHVFSSLGRSFRPKLNFDPPMRWVV